MGSVGYVWKWGPQTLIDDARVEFHCHGVPDDLAQESRRVLAFSLGESSVFHVLSCGFSGLCFFFPFVFFSAGTA